MNHRIGLFDAILIKDNHIAIAGGIDAALANVRARTSSSVVSSSTPDAASRAEAASGAAPGY